MSTAHVVERAIRVLIGEPRTAGLAQPLVRVTATPNAVDRFDVELRFVRGHAYCCAESGCFLPTSRQQWWTRLNELLALCGASATHLTLEVHGVVEAGALLGADPPARPGVPSGAYTYCHGPVHQHEAR